MLHRDVEAGCSCAELVQRENRSAADGSPQFHAPAAEEKDFGFFVSLLVYDVVREAAKRIYVWRASRFCCGRNESE